MQSSSQPAPPPILLELTTLSPSLSIALGLVLVLVFLKQFLLADLLGKIAKTQELQGDALAQLQESLKLLRYMLTGEDDENQ